ncbi:MAG TPA: pyridoxal 5'-phosphate synthase glutaminase subunit PdxT [Acidimicrobiia bacterium]
MKVGVLALQGAVREHRETLETLGVEVVEVRLPQHLSGLDAIVLPGGESTTITRLLDTSQLRAPLLDAIEEGTPVLGTCAGLIVLADEVLDGRADQEPLHAIDLAARRNGYGRQVQSFEARLELRGLDQPFTGVFIRAPLVERVGAAVEVLAEHEGSPVLVRQGAVWGSTFHPELAGDLRVHQLFLREVAA